MGFHFLYLDKCCVCVIPNNMTNPFKRNTMVGIVELADLPDAAPPPMNMGKTLINATKLESDDSSSSLSSSPSNAADATFTNVIAKVLYPTPIPTPDNSNNQNLAKVSRKQKSDAKKQAVYEMTRAVLLKYEPSTWVFAVDGSAAPTNPGPAGAGRGGGCSWLLP